MGEIVEFAGNGSTAHGYLALPPANGPGVIVIQEWWGLVDHIKDVADRFAAEGFVALAPDLYHGKATKEPGEAGKMMMELKQEEASRDMAGAFDFLMAHERVQPKRIGVTGFCMGGGMTLLLTTLRSVAAAAPFYGIPGGRPDWSKVSAPIMGHYAEHDGNLPERARELFAALSAADVDAEMHVYPGTSHAFFNDERPEVYDADAAKTAWERTLTFFRANLT